MRSSTPGLIAIGLLCAGSIGAAPPPPAGNQATDAHRVRPGATVAAAIEAHAHSHQTQKLAAPIGITWRFDSAPVAGIPLVVHLSVTASREIPAANLQLETGDGLQLLAADAVVPLGAIGPGRGAEAAVTVLPASGASHLRVTVAGAAGSGTFRSIRVPIEPLAGTSAAKAVGSTAGKPGSSLLQSVEATGQDDSGNAVRSFRAQ